ncbi:hypothetical protein D3C73_883740 [compost metagenome]
MMFNNHPFIKMLLHLFSIDDIGTFTCLLRLVHRNIGIFQQLLGTRPILWITGNSDTNRDMYTAGIKPKRLTEALNQRLRIINHLSISVHILYQNDKFIPSKTEMPAPPV